jgi:hypothetical protein
MLSRQCETWRGAFLCPGMSLAGCLRRPACSVCLAAGGNTWVEIEYVRCHITVSWFVDVGGSLFEKNMATDFRNLYPGRLCVFLLIADPNKYKY